VVSQENGETAFVQNGAEPLDYKEQIPLHKANRNRFGDCGVLFRGGGEARIRTKLLQDGHIDTVIGLPANLFYSTGIPVCILVLKKCKKPDDVLFINAAVHFEKGKRQNRLWMRTLRR
jgi:type I restriction-modification system DNA methylase subunit